MQGNNCPHCGANFSAQAPPNSCCSVCWGSLSAETNSSSQNGIPSRELLLRFPCPSCCSSLTTPLRSLGIQEKCPGCRQPVTVPTLDAQVVGIEVVRNAFGPVNSRTGSFSHTRKSETRPLSTGESDADKTLPPNRPSRVTSTAEVITPPPVPPYPRDTNHTERRHPKANINPAVSRPKRRDRTSPFFNADDDNPQSPVERTETTPEQSEFVGSARRTYSGSSINPRHARYIVYYFIRFAPYINVLMLPITFPLGHAGPSYLFAFVWFFIGRWVADRITPIVLAAVFRSVRCPGCGESHPFVSQWNCSCGYHDHRLRHLLLFKCPKCSLPHDHFNCPACDATILL